MKQLVEQYEINGFGRVSIIEEPYLHNKYSAVGEFKGEKVIYGNGRDIETTINLAKTNIADGLLSRINSFHAQIKIVLNEKNWKKINTQEPKNMGSGK